LLDKNDQVFVSGLDYEENVSFINREQYMAPELWGPSTGNRTHDKVFMFSLGVEMYYWHKKKFPF
jgi:hypothetical protein